MQQCAALHDTQYSCLQRSSYQHDDTRVADKQRYYHSSPERSRPCGHGKAHRKSRNKSSLLREPRHRVVNTSHFTPVKMLADIAQQAVPLQVSILLLQNAICHYNTPKDVNLIHTDSVFDCCLAAAVVCEKGAASPHIRS